MRVSLSELKKLQVVTRSGKVLGKIYDIIFDVETQSVVQYLVKSSMVGLNMGKYLIGRNQVVGIDGKKITVEDNIEIEGLKNDDPDKEINIDPSPAMMNKSF